MVDLAAAGESWPASAASIWRHALPAQQLEATAAESDAMACCTPNFWMPREAIEGRECRTQAEQAVCSLHERVLSALLPPSWTGVEWWCQVYTEPGKGLAFHWDKDEALMAQSGGMSHPLISSVLYLNSQQECSGEQPLGATLVLEQRFDAETGAGTPEPSRRDVVAWPAHNTLLLFDGRLSHGVLDSASPHVRRTLLVNWWDHQPQSVQRCSAEEYARVHGLAAARRESEESDSPAAARVPLEAVTVLAQRDLDHQALPLDEVLARLRPVTQRGAAALHHPDSVLWQVQAGEEARLVAALLPDAMAAAMADEEESDGDA